MKNVIFIIILIFSSSCLREQKTESSKQKFTDFIEKQIMPNLPLIDGSSDTSFYHTEFKYINSKIICCLKIYHNGYKSIFSLVKIDNKIFISSNIFDLEELYSNSIKNISYSVRNLDLITNRSGKYEESILKDYTTFMLVNNLTYFYNEKKNLNILFKTITEKDLIMLLDEVKEYGEVCILEQHLRTRYVINFYTINFQDHIYLYTITRNKMPNYDLKNPENLGININLFLIPPKPMGL